MDYKGIWMYYREVIVSIIAILDLDWMKIKKYILLICAVLI